MTTTSTHLWTCAHHWRDLQEQLSTNGTATWPPAGRITDYLANIHRTDDEAEAAAYRAAALRALERSPEQIGEVRAPIRLQVLETMHQVHSALLDCADKTAEDVQRPVMSQLGAGYPQADRTRRALLVMQDEADPRRWKWTGRRPTAPYTALWLLARVQGAPGPFRKLTPLQLDHITTVARTAAGHVDRALDLIGQRRELAERHECGGRIDLYGGEGRAPVARCAGCGRIWTESSVVAA